MAWTRMGVRGILGLGAAGLLAAAAAAAAQGPAAGSVTGGDAATATGNSSSTAAPSEQQQPSSTASGTGSAAEAKRADVRQITGRVQAYDPGTQALTLSGGNVNGTTLFLGSETQITRDGQQAMASDIRQGDEVRASLSGSGDRMKVVRLDATSR